MSGLLVLRGRAANYVALAAVGALTGAACGDRSILGSEPTDAADAPSARDAQDVAALDVLGSDVNAPDAGALDVVQPDVVRPDVLDMDARDAGDGAVVAVDVPDAGVGADARDVLVVDATDVVDAAAMDAGPSGGGILGSAAQFTILGGSTVSSMGLSTIVGEVGVWPGLAIVGIPPGTVEHAGDPVAAAAQADTTTAYNNLAALPCGTTLTGSDLGGLTLAPGVYCFATSAMLTGTLTLDGQGQAHPLFVFQMGSTLVTSNLAIVLTTNNARSCDVYWQTGSSATVGVGASFAGNVLAFASVTLMTGASLAGRALARTGAVTMDTNAVSNASCPDPSFPVPADAGARDASDASDGE